MGAGLKAGSPPGRVHASRTRDPSACTRAAGAKAHHQARVADQHDGQQHQASPSEHRPEELDLYLNDLRSSLHCLYLGRLVRQKALRSRSKNSDMRPLAMVTRLSGAGRCATDSDETSDLPQDFSVGVGKTSSLE